MTFLNGHLQLDASLEAARKHIRRKGTGRTLIGGIDDPSTIGAIRAFEETGCSANCAAVGHGAAIEGRAELRRSGSPLVATVAYFPEKYGDALIALAIQILSHRPAPPAVLIKNHVLTAANVDHFPADSAGKSAEMLVSK